MRQKVLIVYRKKLIEYLQRWHFANPSDEAISNVDLANHFIEIPSDMALVTKEIEDLILTYKNQKLFIALPEHLKVYDQSKLPCR